MSEHTSVPGRDRMVQGTALAVGKVREIEALEIEQHINAIQDFGYAVVKNVLPDNLVAALKEDIEAAYNGRSNKNYNNISANQAADRFVYNLQYRAKPYIDLLSIDPVSKLVSPFLNDPYFKQIPEDRPNYILAYYNARMSVVELPLHLDSYIPFPGPRTFSMQAIFVLDDQSRDNGCSLVVPGSHLFGEYPDRSFKDVTPVESEAGDLVVWDSRLWHGAGENRALQSRWSLIATFRMWWAKQSMDITRGVSEELYHRLSDEQKALLGFCSIPPRDETQRISMKIGYADLESRASDYFD